MQHRFLAVLILVAAGLTGCSDFRNRLYHYREEIPLKPFVMKAIQAEYGTRDDKIMVKVSLRVANRSPSQNPLSRNCFVLRVGGTREVNRDKSLLESLGLKSISFSPGEETTLVVPFMISRDDLKERLDLIVDRARTREQKHLRLTLIELKKGGMPRSLPIEGEWMMAHGARW